MHNPYAAPRAGLEPRFEPADEARLIAWHGRLGRVRFLAYSLAGLAFAFIFMVAVGVLHQLLGVTPVLDFWRTQVSTAIFLLLPVLAIANAARRRLHDFDVSGWAALFLLFPIFQFVFLIYLLVAPGMPEANRFGPVPKPADWGVKLGAAIGCLLLLGFTALRFL